MQYQVNRKENIYFFIMFIISCIFYLSIFAAFYAIPGLIAKISPFLIIASYIFGFLFLMTVFLIGYFKGNGIKVSESQFPDIYGILKAHSETLGLQRVPEMYIIQGNGVLNAFATKWLARNFVVLYSNILEAAYEDRMDAVSFVIGHELGHIKRGHLSFLKSLFILPAKLIPFLGNAYSRACEYTCDAIGFSLVPQAGVNGLLVLAAGKMLYKRINIKALDTDFKSQSSAITTIVELFSTHPRITKRVLRIRELEKEHALENIDAYMNNTPKYQHAAGN